MCLYEGHYTSNESKIDVDVEEIKGHLKNRNIKLFQVFKTKMKTLFFIYIIRKINPLQSN